MKWLVPFVSVLIWAAIAFKLSVSITKELISKQSSRTRFTTVLILLDLFILFFPLAVFFSWMILDSASSGDAISAGGMLVVFVGHFFLPPLALATIISIIIVLFTSRSWETQIGGNATQDSRPFFSRYRVTTIAIIIAILFAFSPFILSGYDRYVHWQREKEAQKFMNLGEPAPREITPADMLYDPVTRSYRIRD